MSSNNANQKLNDLLLSRDFNIQSLDAQGKPAQNPEDAVMFSFDYKGESGKDYGTVIIMLNDDLTVYFGDNVGKTMEAGDKDGWFNFLQQLRQFAMRNAPGGFSTQNLNKLKYSMQGQAALKEGLFEGWSGTKNISWNAEPTEARLMIKHKKTIDEGDARFRYIESLFIETADGERFRMPFKSLSAGRAMLEHVRQGGKPYDVRGNHITTIVEELNLLSRFKRANQGKIFEGETQQLVEEATQYYETLQRNLKSLSSKTGYKKYFESWNPAALTDEDVIIEDLRHLFVEQNIDQRVEQALPLLAKLKQEHAMKEANIFESMMNLITEGTWALPDTKEKQQKLVALLGKELPVGADATNATEILYDLLGDDILFDQLSDLAQQDANADARPVIIDRLEQLKNNPAVAQVIGQIKLATNTQPKEPTDEVDESLLPPVKIPGREVDPIEFDFDIEEGVIAPIVGAIGGAALGGGIGSDLGSDFGSDVGGAIGKSIGTEKAGTLGGIIGQASGSSSGATQGASAGKSLGTAVGGLAGLAGGAALDSATSDDKEKEKTNETELGTAIGAGLGGAVGGIGGAALGGLAGKYYSDKKAEQETTEAAGDVMFRHQEYLDRLERLRDIARRSGNQEQFTRLDNEIKRMYADHPVGMREGWKDQLASAPSNVTNRHGEYISKLERLRDIAQRSGNQEQFTRLDNEIKRMGVREGWKDQLAGASSSVTNRHGEYISKLERLRDIAQRSGNQEQFTRLDNEIKRMGVREGWKGQLAGGTVGTLAGGALGAAAPIPFGTAIGGALGGTAGQMLGDKLGGKDEEETNEGWMDNVLDKLNWDSGDIKDTQPDGDIEVKNAFRKAQANNPADRQKMIADLTARAKAGDKGAAATLAAFKRSAVSEEELDELSSDTLKSYIKKASSDRAMNNFDQGFNAGSSSNERTPHFDKEIDRRDDNRRAGIHKAIDRLEELSLDTISSYKEKASADKHRQQRRAEVRGHDDGPEAFAKYMRRSQGLDRADSRLEESGMSEVAALYDDWMNSEYAPYDSDSGDDEVVMSKAMQFLRGQVPPEKLEAIAGLLANNFHSGSMDETVGGGNWLEETDAANALSNEGFRGALAGGALGAVATKSVRGTLAGAKLGSAVQDHYNKSKVETNEGVSLQGQYGHSGKLEQVSHSDPDIMERIKFLAGLSK